MRSLFKKIGYFLLIFVLFTNGLNALSENYIDKVSDVMGENTEEDKVNIYLFYSMYCPHCHDELEFLDTLKYKNDYKDKINIYTYEVTSSEENSEKLIEIKEMYEDKSLGVPFTVIGDKYIVGYGDGTSERIENILNEYLEIEGETDSYKLPFLGKINARNASITLVAIVLGLIDGFNPCAMWILLLLINMSLATNNRKKMIWVGVIFLLTSGSIYFISMLGMGVIIDLAMVSIIRDVIAGVAIILGIFNLRTYIKTRKETGCHVVEKNKRKNIINKINKILASKSFFLGLLGTVFLAISVNLIELACSLGFPTVFLEILSINGIVKFKKIVYLLVYILFYLIDDFVVFLIAVFTLKSKGISTKYNKLVNLIGGILMILMGILLIFKPEWIMLNF